MKQFVCASPSALRRCPNEEVPDAVPAFGGVLVKDAAGTNPTEVYWPLLTDRACHKRDYIIPAHEVSGVLVTVGYGTAGVAVGGEGLRPYRSLP